MSLPNAYHPNSMNGVINGMPGNQMNLNMNPMGGHGMNPMGGGGGGGNAHLQYQGVQGHIPQQSSHMSNPNPNLIQMNQMGHMNQINQMNQMNQMNPQMNPQMSGINMRQLGQVPQMGTMNQNPLNQLGSSQGQLQVPQGQPQHTPSSNSQIGQIGTPMGQIPTGGQINPQSTHMDRINQMNQMNQMGQINPMHQIHSPMNYKIPQNQNLQTNSTQNLNPTSNVNSTINPNLTQNINPTIINPNTLNPNLNPNLNSTERIVPNVSHNVNVNQPMNQPQFSQTPNPNINRRPSQFSTAHRSQIHPGVCVMRLIHYSEAISRRNEENDIEFWKKFVVDYFAQNGVMKYALWNSQYRENRTFELNTALLARYYKVNFDSGIKNIQLLMENPKEYILANSLMLVDCPKASLVYIFNEGIQVVSYGHLRVTFLSNLKIQIWEFHTKRHTELIPREILLRKLAHEPPQDGDNHSEEIPIPESPINEFGITIKTMRCLEIAEVVCHMRDLMNFSESHNIGPIDSLKSYVAQMRDLPPRPNQNAIQGVNQPNQAGVVNKFPPTTQHPASFQKPQNGSLLNTQNPQNVGTPLNNEVPPSPSTNQQQTPASSPEESKKPGAKGKKPKAGGVKKKVTQPKIKKPSPTETSPKLS